jgi:myosin-5
VLEVIRLAQAGYPARCLMADFARRYALPLPGVGARSSGETDQQACQRLLAAYGIKAGQVVFGSSKLFFRAGVLGLVEDLFADKQRLISRVGACVACWRWRMQQAKIRRAATVVQAAWRGVCARKELKVRRRGWGVWGQVTAEGVLCVIRQVKLQGQCRQTTGSESLCHRTLPSKSE